jgi:hypothetical protein
MLPQVGHANVTGGDKPLKSQWLVFILCPAAKYGQGIYIAMQKNTD